MLPAIFLHKFIMSAVSCFVDFCVARSDMNPFRTFVSVDTSDSPWQVQNHGHNLYPLLIELLGSFVHLFALEYLHQVYQFSDDWYFRFAEKTNVATLDAEALVYIGKARVRWRADSPPGKISRAGTFPCFPKLPPVCFAQFSGKLRQTFH